MAHPTGRYNGTSGAAAAASAGEPQDSSKGAVAAAGAAAIAEAVAAPRPSHGKRPAEVVASAGNANKDPRVEAKKRNFTYVFRIPGLSQLIGNFLRPSPVRGLRDFPLLPGLAPLAGVCKDFNAILHQQQRAQTEFLLNGWIRKLKAIPLNDPDRSRAEETCATITAFLNRGCSTPGDFLRLEKIIATQWKLRTPEVTARDLIALGTQPENMAWLLTFFEHLHKPYLEKIAQQIVERASPGSTDDWKPCVKSMGPRLAREVLERSLNKWDVGRGFEPIWNEIDPKSLPADLAHFAVKDFNETDALNWIRNNHPDLLHVRVDGKSLGCTALETLERDVLEDTDWDLPPAFAWIWDNVPALINEDTFRQTLRRVLGNTGWRCKDPILDFFNGRMRGVFADFSQRGEHIAFEAIQNARWKVEPSMPVEAAFGFLQWLVTNRPELVDVQDAAGRTILHCMIDRLDADKLTERTLDQILHSILSDFDRILGVLSEILKERPQLFAPQRGNPCPLFKYFLETANASPAPIHLRTYNWIQENCPALMTELGADGKLAVSDELHREFVTKHASFHL